MAAIDQRRDAFRGMSSASAALAARARKVMPGGNTRTTVYRRRIRPTPRRQGRRIVDVEGDERLDFLNNYTSLIHGHADPDINAAVIEQLAATAPSFAMPTVRGGRARRTDRAIGCPSAEHVRFTNSGTEAVMMAIKGARAFTGRPKIAKFEGCLSRLLRLRGSEPGDARVALGGSRRRPPPATAFGTPQARDGECARAARFNDSADAERVIARHHDELAAVLVDPMPSRVGQ